MLTTNEVAQEMGVAYTTVMLWIKQGKLEAIKRVHPRGNYYEVPVSALKKLDRGTKGRPPKPADAEQVAVSTDNGEEASALEVKPAKATKKAGSKRVTKTSAKKRTQ